MIGAFWNELFKLGDEVKKKYGSTSNEYKVIRELDKRFQQCYDEKNAITSESLDKPCSGPADWLI